MYNFHIIHVENGESQSVESLNTGPHFTADMNRLFPGNSNGIFSFMLTVISANENKNISLNISKFTHLLT